MGLKMARLMALVPQAGAALLSADTGTSTFDVTTVVTDSVKTVQSQLFTVLGIVVPSIVTIVAAVVGVKFAISWIKRIRG